jgi:hypothetical protein
VNDSQVPQPGSQSGQQPEFPGVPDGQPPLAQPGQGWVPVSDAYPAKGRSKLWIVVLAIVGGVIALAAIIWFLPGNDGKVLFTTKQPQAGFSCGDIPDTVTSMSKGTHAWVVVVFKEKMDDQPVTLEATLNGQLLASPETLPVSKTNGQKCLADNETDLAQLPPGTYKFTVRHRGEVESEGTLTVK